MYVSLTPTLKISSWAEFQSFDETLYESEKFTNAFGDVDLVYHQLLNFVPGIKPKSKYKKLKVSYEVIVPEAEQFHDPRLIQGFHQDIGEDVPPYNAFNFVFERIDNYISKLDNSRKK